MKKRSKGSSCNGEEEQFITVEIDKRVVPRTQKEKYYNRGTVLLR